MAESLCFPVRRGVSRLHPAVMATTQHASVLIEQGCANGNAAFNKSLPGFVDSDL
jgi:hypothetical protein